MEGMSERELADFYQAHKDDPDLWEDADPPEPRRRRRPSRGLKAIITVRFTSEEADVIRREAAATSATYSDVVRRAIRLLAAAGVHQAL